MVNGILDEIDFKILNILQRDARIDVVQLAKQVHLSRTPVNQRIMKLQHSGFIKGFVAQLDRNKVGKPVMVVSLVKLEKQTKKLLQEFEETANTMEEVQFCLHLSGSWDFMLQITAGTPQDYYDFLMERLCNLPNVAHVESSFVLKECKSHTPFVFKTENVISPTFNKHTHNG